MNYYFITGTSRGIGKATAELLLQNKNNIVYGISRSNSIDDSSYIHFPIDLSDLNSVRQFVFPDFENADTLVLMNNSAYEDIIIHFGKKDNDDIINSCNVNYISPAILSNNFLKKYRQYNCKKIIMNISTGAAHRPIESWSTYCSSKAALYMLSEVIGVEQKLEHVENPAYVFSVGPGIVDTQMQTELRKVDPVNFSQVGLFKEYFEKGQLAKPGDVAAKLIKIMEHPEKFEKVMIQVKDID